MKSYERFLKGLGGLFKIIVIGLFLIGVVGGIGYAVFTGTAEDEAVRETNLIAREWCIDNGGRTARIDGVTGCFQLSEVELEVGFWNSRESECKRDPTVVWMKPPNGGNQRYCYSYTRIKKEQ